MRRALLLLISLLMLVQSTWAATAQCCLDEATGQAAIELLHPQADTPASDDAKHLCEVGHCHCHHGCVAAGAEQWLSLDPDPGLAPRADGPAHDKSHIPAGLDRPNWLRA